MKQKGFFEEEVVRNMEADKIWTPEENDRFIELYLAGTPPDRISILLERNPKSIKRRLEQYTYNERGITERYDPVRRTSRKGKRFTENEMVLRKAWKKNNVPGKAQATFLMREPSELGVEGEEMPKLVDMKKVGTGVDLVLAYRYLYYVKGISILSDQAYDSIEKEELEFGANSQILKIPGSDRSEDYPPHIRALALYLAFKYSEKEKK